MSGETDARAIQVISVNDDHTFTLDEAALESILLQEEVKERSVVVVSVTGPFRKGKSFLLSLFIRYLQSQGECDWLEDEDSPLKGFHWRGGSNSDTKGILMWSEPFLVERPCGEKLAVILMDTQGIYDCESTMNESATIFAMSTMLSSVQVYNISNNIQEDDFLTLQMFTEYGKFAVDEAGETPFQKLQFLVRDWISPAEHPFGLDGGRKLLEKRLKVTKTQQKELRIVRQSIKSCFAEISCCLMPHPGEKVSENSNFDGRLKDIRPDFTKILKVFVDDLLGSENLLVKEVGGQKIKAKELPIYCKTYMALFKEGKIPEVKSMVQATADANNESAVSAAKDLYRYQMQMLFGDGKPLLKENELLDEHNKVKTAAMKHFQEIPKFGGEEFSGPFIPILDEGLEKLRDEFVAQNKKAWEAVEANNRSAVAGAKDVYRSGMKELFDVEGNFLLEEELLAEHEKMKMKSQEYFKQQPNLGGEEFSKPFGLQLEDELKKIFEEFKVKNGSARDTVEANNNSAVVKEKELYRLAMQNALSSERLLKESELLSEHHIKKAESLNRFQQMSNKGKEDFWKPFYSQLDEDLEQIYANIVNQYEQKKVTLETNNRSAVADAKELYRSKMQEFFAGDETFFNEVHLQTTHITMKGEALDNFCNLPNIGDEEFSKPFIHLLEKEIDEIYPEFVTRNLNAKDALDAKNNSAVSAAKEFYRSQMQDLLGNTKPLLNDSALCEEHEKVKKEAFQIFQQSSVGSSELLTPFESILAKELDKIYPGFVAQNQTLFTAAKENNISAVSRAKEFYSTRMQNLLGDCKPCKETLLQEEHMKQKKAALEHFKSMQKLGGESYSDSFMPRLEQEIDSNYIQLVEKNNKLLERTCKANNATAVSSSKEFYRSQMLGLLAGPKSTFEDHVLLIEHRKFMRDAFEHFRQQPDIGDEDFSKPYLHQLQQEIEKIYPDFVAQNKASRETAKANNKIAMEGAKESYRSKMRQCIGSKPFLAENELLSNHEKIKADAVDLFQQKIEASVGESAQPLLHQLQMELENVYQEFVVKNSQAATTAASKFKQDAFTSAKALYRSRMMSFCQTLDASEGGANKLKMEHLQITTGILSEFNGNRPNFGIVENLGQDAAELEEELNHAFQDFANIQKSMEERLEAERKKAEKVKAPTEGGTGAVLRIFALPVTAVCGFVSGAINGVIDEVKKVL